MTIIVSRNGQDAKILNRSDFQEENSLQEYIHNNPESIPIFELKEDKRLFVAKREFPTNSGPIDALAFDKDGDIYIIETKLYKNHDKRTVVAQALDYGAALWKHFNDFNNFMEILDAETQRKFNLNFQEKLEDFFEIENEQSENIMESIRDNLADGNIKFVILMDSIDERLKDLIIYVNQKSQFDIYAVQFDYYRFEAYEIIIPKLFGVEVNKTIPKPIKRTQWDKDSFMDEMETKVGRTETSIAQNLLNWANSQQLEPQWLKTVNAQCHLLLKFNNEPYKIFSISAEWGGKIWNRFADHSKYPPFDSEEKRREFLKRLNSIEGISISSNETVTNTPSIMLSNLNNESTFTSFIKSYEWLINEIKTHRKSG